MSLLISSPLIGSGVLNPGGGAPASAGLSWTPTFGDAQNLAFGSATYTISGVTMGAGVFVLFVGDNAERAKTVTIGGVSATLVDTASDFGAMYYASVSTPTGSIVISAGTAFGQVAACGGLLTGVTATPTTTGVLAAGFYADPQTVTATVPTGGIGIAGLIAAGAPHLPASWANATRDAACEAELSGGMTVAMAHTTTAGSQSPAASGSGAAFSFTGTAMIMGCWGP